MIHDVAVAFRSVRFYVLSSRNAKAAAWMYHLYLRVPDQHVHFGVGHLSIHQDSKSHYSGAHWLLRVSVAVAQDQGSWEVERGGELCQLWVYPASSN
jgi:hypothetical protein